MPATAMPTWAEVTYKDAAGRYTTLTYRMATSLLDDGSNFADVMTSLGNIETYANALTMDKVTSVALKFYHGGGGAAPNIAANNQVHARSYCTDADGTPVSFDVPAWDVALYAEDAFGLLNGVYNTAAAFLKGELANRETGAVMSGGITNSVSKTHSQRGKQVKTGLHGSV